MSKLPLARRLAGKLRDLRVSLPVTLSLIGLNLAPTVGAEPPVTRPADDGAAQVVIVNVPGIAGLQRKDTGFLDALVEGLQADGDVTVVNAQHFRWRRGRTPIQTLQGREQNDVYAAELAELLATLRREHPRARLLVTSHSGGTGIAAWAIAQLEAEGDAPPVDGLLLLASALSPTFDLSPALANVGKAASVVSEFDTILLVAGTRSFGTIDGIKVAAAGQTGFAMPDGGDAGAYATLRELEYDADWEELGWYGDHEGMLKAAPTRRVLVPVARELLGLPIEVEAGEGGANEASAAKVVAGLRPMKEKAAAATRPESVGAATPEASTP